MRERDVEDLIEAAKEVAHNGHAPYCPYGEDGRPCCCGIENLRDVLERIQ